MKLELKPMEVVTVRFALLSKKAQLKKYLKSEGLEEIYIRLASDEIVEIDELLNKLK